MSVRLIVVSVLLLITTRGRSQQHYNSWARFTFSAPVSSRLRLDAEFQHRRQNDYDNRSYISQNLLGSFRTWVHYQYSPDIQVSFSPFAFYRLYRLISIAADTNQKPSSEVRFTMAASMQKSISTDLFLTARTAVEYRDFSTISPVVRVRNRMGARFDCKKMSVFLYDELLTNVSGVQKGHFFDHNRLGAAISVRAVKHIGLEMGYMYINRRLLSDLADHREQTLYLNVQYSLK